MGRLDGASAHTTGRFPRTASAQRSWKEGIRAAARLALPVITAFGVAGCGDAGDGKNPGENASGGHDGETQSAAQALAAPTCVTFRRGVFGTVQDTQLARTTTKPAAIDPLANANYGALATGLIGSVAATKATYKTLVKVDLSSIPATAVVTAASLTVKVSTSGPATLEARNVLDFWDETRVTYNTFKNRQELLNPAVSVVANPPAAAGLRVMSIASLAQSWVNGSIANNGVVLIQEGNKLTTLSTSEAVNVADRPAFDVCYTVPDADGDGFAAPADCDDGDPSIHPGAAEVCNGKDDTCDGTTDEGDPGGGAACASGQQGVCAAGTKHCLGGALVCQANLAPGPETCDGLDNDCDGAVDDDATNAPTWYPDVDGDSFGTPSTSVSSCAQPAGYVAQAGDCSDGDAEIHPGATELCNGVDDDCSGAADEGNPGGGLACATGQLGVCAAGTTACSGGGLVCNQDAQASAETCDGVDNDCNGAVDDGAADADVWYLDADNDGHGNAAVSVQACAQPMGYVLLGDDCNDNDPTIYPGVNGSCGGHMASATLAGGVSAHSPSYSGVFSLGQSPGGAGNASSPSYRFHGGLIGATQGK